MSIEDISKIATNVAPLKTDKSQDKNIEKTKANHAKLSASEDNATDFKSGNVQGVKSRGLSQALSNIGDAKNILSIADGGLQNILSVLQTMKEKAVKASGNSIGKPERDDLDNQLNQLADEIDSIVNNDAKFNGTNLLDGTFAGKSTRVGPNAENVFSVAIHNGHSSEALTVSGSNIDVSSETGVKTSITKIDNAIATVSNSISSVKSQQNTLAANESSISSAITNYAPSKNSITDDKMLDEQLKTTINDILHNRDLAFMAQASNASAQNVIQLL